MELKIQKLEPVKVVSMRHTGPYGDCHEIWMKMVEWGKQNHLFEHETLGYGASYDDPTTVPADKLRYDCCFSIPDDFSVDDDSVRVHTISGGEYAVFTLKGSYDKIGPSFRQIMAEGMPKLGRECRESACLEIYRTDPTVTPEDENITDLLIPLK